MQNLLRFPGFNPTEKDSTYVFRILIVYEDFETGKQAKRTSDSLIESLGQRWRFENQMWKFDVLGIPKLREMAVNDALIADLVIVSCHGDELPQGVRKWFEDWVGRKAHSSALVALLDSCRTDSGRTRAVCAELAAIARRAHMEFFAPERDSKAEDDPVFEQRAQATIPVALTDSILREPVSSNWGQQRLA